MSLDEVLSKISCLSEKDRDLLMALPPTYSDKFLQKLLEADKQSNPYMYGAMSILFDVTPKIANNLLIRNTASDENLYLAMFIQSFQLQVLDWIDKNIDSLYILEKCSKNFEVITQNDTRHLGGINEIAEEEEQEFLSCTDNAEYQKRMQTLAAVELVALYDRVVQVFRYSGILAAKAAMIYTFLYMRSFVQFTASQAVTYGIGVQAARRTKHRGKNKALMAIKFKYQNEFPGVPPRTLWREIYKTLSRGNHFEYEGYWVEFKSNASSTDIYSGELVQKTEGKKNISWNFSTFRRKEVS